MIVHLTFKMLSGLILCIKNMIQLEGLYFYLFTIRDKFVLNL